MPYLPTEIKNNLDPAIARLKEKIVDQGDRWKDGCMNYSTCMLSMIYKNGYMSFCRLLGTLLLTLLELWRRRVVPYEEKKKEINGDVF